MTINRAPFSFGSQPQKRPHDWSAQMPPSTVPTKLASVPKQTIAVDDLSQRLFERAGQQTGRQPHDDINDAEQAGAERRRVAKIDDGDMGRQPEAGVEHGLEHLHRVAFGRVQRQEMGDDQRHRPSGRGDGRCRAPMP